MDNAPRALIMAASILLGVMLFSVFVAMFRAGARVDQAYDEKQIENALNKFNSKFEIYDKNDNTIMDIITVCNAVYDVNEDYIYDNAKAIDITLKIGNKYFTIPRDEPTGEFRKSFERNKIFPISSNNIKNINQESISIYKLADTPLSSEPLKITGGISDGENTDTKEKTKPNYDTDKLSLTKLGTILDRDNNGNIKKDASGNEIYKSNVTIYKYVFVPKHVCNNSSHVNGISYNYFTGRVNSLEFEVQINPNWYE